MTAKLRIKAKIMWIKIQWRAWLNFSMFKCAKLSLILSSKSAPLVSSNTKLELVVTHHYSLEILMAESLAS